MSPAFSENSLDSSNSSAIQGSHFNSTVDHQLRTVPSGPNDSCEFHDVVSNSKQIRPDFIWVQVINYCAHCKAYNVVIDCSVKNGPGSTCVFNNGGPLWPLQIWNFDYPGPYGQFPVLNAEFPDCDFSLIN
ncbi:hypothetical protein SUGI_1014580 [Cryptomeria japonica]|nr:hypothetical protein SUGI_1014580 [Cryptomeria japonica]